MRHLAVLGFAASLVANQATAETREYRGLCEASAAAALDDRHFAVASDETNVLFVYERGIADPVAKFDFEPFTTFGGSDLEGAARVGSRVYWISSHSFNKNGQDRDKRKVFFATDVGFASGRPVLRAVGKPAFGLRDDLAAAAGVPNAELNLEGLAAAAEGLLLGLRGPLVDGKAIVVPLENPAAVVEASQAPRFGSAVRLDLGGLGIRSMDWVGSGERAYVITAGPVEDGSAPFRLYWWSGRPDDLSPKLALEMWTGDNLIPEALVAFPDQTSFQILSDDGNRCSDEGPAHLRRFRSVDVSLPEAGTAK
ncbi:DUF3616 domain-containing protein [Methylobacterium trifolii]|uniref:DUF3616 domain-containing protein n=1 Tax=Methylobacterium trifolii TaxID=1003092 RepID=A0ABQ4U6L8_9HYPH|nr:DUF3616 domain-containing protein [Methylobacterium trifolii]GJE62047.1 hypothetical protein MPOCJGCO_4176 [Methylobacterium trifolii]